MGSKDNGSQSDRPYKVKTWRAYAISTIAAIILGALFLTYLVQMIHA